MGKNKVLISYSHQDEEWKELFVKPLRVLEKQGLLTLWVDSDIPAGANREQEIENAIAQTRGVILLVSDNFLGDDFITDKEVPYFQQRREAGTLTIFPVIIKDCLWDITWLKQIEVRPKDGKPLFDFDKAERENIVREIVREIKKQIDCNNANRFEDNSLQKRDNTPQRPRQVQSMDAANNVIEQLMAEQPNQWDWEKDLPELNFVKAFNYFVEQLQQHLKPGLSPVFLLQKSNSMGGEHFLLKAKSLLERQIRVSCPVEIRFQSKPSAFEILNSLATYVNMKHTDEQDWQAYAVNIIERLFKPLRRNSDVVFIELKNGHYLSSDVLEWFVNEFWTLVESKLAVLSKNYIRVICVITADKKIKPSSEKLIELPLDRWEVAEIQDWLERYSNLDACSDFEAFAQDIYECCDDGLPKLVCEALKERLTQI